MSLIEMLNKEMPEFKNLRNMSDKELEEYAKELADASYDFYRCVDAIFTPLHKAGFIPDYNREALMKDVVDFFEECLLEAQTDPEHEETGSQKTSRAKGTDVWNKSKPLKLPEMNKVILYHPAYGPSVAWEPVVMRGFDFKSTSVKELRFLDTDFLICFKDEDVDRVDSKYYLDGPAVIYAIDKDEHIRSLSDAEISKIVSACLYKEEALGSCEAPVLRLC